VEQCETSPVDVVEPQVEPHDPDVQVVAQAAQVVEHQGPSDTVHTETSKSTACSLFQPGREGVTGLQQVFSRFALRCTDSIIVTNRWPNRWGGAHRFTLVLRFRGYPSRLSGPLGSGASRPASRSCSLKGSALYCRFRVPSPTPESSGAGCTPKLKSFLVLRIVASIRCVGYLHSHAVI